jgi:hypothetical protein
VSSDVPTSACKSLSLRMNASSAVAFLAYLPHAFDRFFARAWLAAFVSADNRRVKKAAVLHRGLSVELASQCGSEFTTWNFTSTSTDGSRAIRFATNISTGTYESIRDGCGVDVAELSLHAGENEVLVLPGARFFVVDNFRPDASGRPDFRHLLLQRLPRRMNHRAARDGGTAGGSDAVLMQHKPSAAAVCAFQLAVEWMAVPVGVVRMDAVVTEWGEDARVTKTVEYKDMDVNGGRVVLGADLHLRGNGQGAVATARGQTSSLVASSVDGGAGEGRRGEGASAAEHIVEHTQLPWWWAGPSPGLYQPLPGTRFHIQLRYFVGERVVMSLPSTVHLRPTAPPIVGVASAQLVGVHRIRVSFSVPLNGGSSVDNARLVAYVLSAQSGDWTQLGGTWLTVLNMEAAGMSTFVIPPVWRGSNVRLAAQLHNQHGWAAVPQALPTHIVSQWQELQVPTLSQFVQLDAENAERLKNTLRYRAGRVLLGIKGRWKEIRRVMLELGLTSSSVPVGPDDHVVLDGRTVLEYVRHDAARKTQHSGAAKIVRKLEEWLAPAGDAAATQTRQWLATVGADLPGACACVFPPQQLQLIARRNCKLYADHLKDLATYCIHPCALCRRSPVEPGGAWGCSCDTAVAGELFWCERRRRPRLHLRQQIWLQTVHCVRCVNRHQHQRCMPYAMQVRAVTTCTGTFLAQTAQGLSACVSLCFVCCAGFSRCWDDIPYYSCGRAEAAVVVCDVSNNYPDGQGELFQYAHDIGRCAGEDTMFVVVTGTPDSAAAAGEVMDHYEPCVGCFAVCAATRRADVVEEPFLRAVEAALVRRARTTMNRDVIPLRPFGWRRSRAELHPAS